jgi:hypothetical protein
MRLSDWSADCPGLSRCLASSTRRMSRLYCHSAWPTPWEATYTTCMIRVRAASESRCPGSLRRAVGCRRAEIISVARDRFSTTRSRCGSPSPAPGQPVRCWVRCIPRVSLWIRSMLGSPVRSGNDDHRSAAASTTSPHERALALAVSGGASHRSSRAAVSASSSRSPTVRSSSGSGDPEACDEPGIAVTRRPRPRRPSLRARRSPQRHRRGTPRPGADERRVRPPG